MNRFRQDCFRCHDRPTPGRIEIHAVLMSALAAVKQANEGTRIQKKFITHDGVFVKRTRDGAGRDREHAFPENREGA